MPFVLAAGAVPPFLAEVVLLVAAAAGVAYVCQRLGLVPIVGFLLAGVAIGPNALGLVNDPELIDAAAELGVLLLLFTIGIEFSLDKLARIKRLIFVGGGLQVALVTVVVTGLCVTFGIDWRIGVYSGFLAALSSTAIVTKLLGDRGETGSPHGQSAVGVLIFQDLAIIVMVLLVPALAVGGGGEPFGAAELGVALGKAALIIAFVLVVARRALPPLLEVVARTCSAELFLLTVIAVCLGTAYAVGLAGVSIALGAFLAGLIVSESRFSEHALSEILPLQILFSATFFVSVGLMLDLGFMVQNLGLVLAVIAGAFAVKLVTTFVAVRAVGRAAPVAAASALWLAQLGEFSFVLERAGREVGLTPLGLGEAGAQSFVAATVVLMALTPVVAPFARRLGDAMQARSEAPPEPEAAPDPEHFADLENHVIVAGYGDAGRHLVHVLDGSGVPFVIVTLSPAAATEAESEGRRVLRGDYAKQAILNAVGLERAKLLVVPDDRPAQTHRVVAVARALAPTLRIVAAVPTMHDAEEIVAAGADRAIAAEFETVVGLFDDVLRSYQVAPAEILAHEEALRRGSYHAFDADAMGTPAVECELDADCFSTRTVTIRAGAPADGRSLADLELDERRLHVVELRHDGDAEREPGGATVLEAGDEVLIGGTPDAFIAAGDLFRAPDAAPPAPPPIPPVTAQTADWIDPTAPVTLSPKPGVACDHARGTLEAVPGTQGCAECLEHGGTWVHLRVCMDCGHVGCCDSSPGKHATAHARETAHPVVRSIEPGETWGWCYSDEVML